MKQSRFMSLLESTANIAVGYALALATQMIVFPLFGFAILIMKQSNAPDHSNQIARLSAWLRGKAAPS